MSNCGCDCHFCNDYGRYRYEKFSAYDEPKQQKGPEYCGGYGSKGEFYSKEQFKNHRRFKEAEGGFHRGFRPQQPMHVQQIVAVPGFRPQQPMHAQQIVAVPGFRPQQPMHCQRTVDMLGNNRVYNRNFNINGARQEVIKRNYYNNYYTRYNHYYIPIRNCSNKYLRNAYYCGSEIMYCGNRYLGSTCGINRGCGLR